MARDRKSFRPVRPSKEDLLAKLQQEARARQESSVLMEAWQIPVPLLDHDPDLTNSSATNADALVHCNISTDSDLIFNTAATKVGRLIKVVMISGEELELLVQPTDTVRFLAQRVAESKRGGRVMLLVDQAPLQEDSLVLDCVPCACVVTAILQSGFNFPDSLDPVMEQQIRFCYELHGGRVTSGRLLDPTLLAKATEANLDPETFWRVAWEKQTWEEFAHHIGAKDFQIRVFSFGLNPFHQTRFIYYSFDMGNYAYGTVHAENEVNCTAEYNFSRSSEYHFPGERFDSGSGNADDETRRFLKELDSAAYSKHGVERYGFW